MLFDLLTPGERGHVVNIVDWRALRPDGSHLAYNVSKAGLVALTQSLALSLGPHAQVNAIALGAMLPRAGDKDDAAYFAALADRSPLHRTGSTDDVAGALLYLLRSDFVTGEVMRVTGGEEL